MERRGEGGVGGEAMTCLRAESWPWVLLLVFAAVPDDDHFLLHFMLPARLWMRVCVARVD